MFSPELPLCQTTGPKLGDTSRPRWSLQPSRVERPSGSAAGAHVTARSKELRCRLLTAEARNRRRSSEPVNGCEDLRRAVSDGSAFWRPTRVRGLLRRLGMWPLRGIWQMLDEKATVCKYSAPECSHLERLWLE